MSNLKELVNLYDDLNVSGQSEVARLFGYSVLGECAAKYAAGNDTEVMRVHKHLRIAFDIYLKSLLEEGTEF